MKKIFLVNLSLIFMLLLVMSISCTTQSSVPDGSSGAEVDKPSDYVIDAIWDFMDGYEEKEMYVKQASDVLPVYESGDAAILDVRPDAHRQQGFIPGSLHIPMSELLERMYEIPTDMAVMVHCTSNINCGYSVLILNLYGYEAYVLANGINAWEEAGGEITTSSCPPTG